GRASAEPQTREPPARQAPTASEPETVPGPSARAADEAGPNQPEPGNVSPIARRIAAERGIDLSRVEGSARGGRITKADVLAAAGNGDGLATAPRPGVAPGAQPLRGGAAALAHYMDESRSVPTATSFRTLPVTVLDQRRAQLKDAGHRVSFTHLIAYAVAL